jgi:hypothetical protein
MLGMGPYAITVVRHKLKVEMLMWYIMLWYSTENLGGVSFFEVGLL